MRCHWRLVYFAPLHDDGYRWIGHRSLSLYYMIRFVSQRAPVFHSSASYLAGVRGIMVGPSRWALLEHAAENSRTSRMTQPNERESKQSHITISVWPDPFLVYLTFNTLRFILKCYTNAPFPFPFAERQAVGLIKFRLLAGDVLSIVLPWPMPQGEMVWAKENRSADKDAGGGNGLRTRRKFTTEFGRSVVSAVAGFQSGWDM